MKRDLISFFVGVAVGAVLGVLVSDEDKKKIQKTLGKQAVRLRRELTHEHPIREGAEKLKKFVKEHLG
ncbi:MAG: hypothetical protein MUC61_01630 [Amoebophilaceae bacterium]|jgi:gas vesicle protein|nr:hypothetical protein [Amoebophilaceae bacterium]